MTKSYAFGRAIFATSMAEHGARCLLRCGALLIADSVSNIPVAPHTVA